MGFVVNKNYSLVFSVGIISILLSIIMSFMYSKIAINNYLSGIDIRTEHLMIEIGQSIELDETGHGIMVGYHVTDSWDKLDKPFRENFSPDLALNKFNKFAINKSPFAPPDVAYFLLITKNIDNEYRYIYRQIQPKLRSADTKKPPPRMMTPPDLLPRMLVLSGIFVALYGFAIIALFWYSRKPVKALIRWVKSFNMTQVQQPIPNFHFSELNSLASIFADSYRMVQDGVEREKQFLSYASHELRTPISATKSNLELLHYVLQHSDSAQKALEIQQRLERSNNTTINLIETLLWLSRNETQKIASEVFDLCGVIHEAIEKNHYLTEDKPISLTIDVSPFELRAAKVPCQIIISNLIRNAFQHTTEGCVTISQVGGTVHIINPQCDTELGFGLGRELIRKMSDKYKWHYVEDKANGSYTAVIQFK